VREAFSLTDAGSDIRQDLEELQMRGKDKSELTPQEAKKLRDEQAAEHAKAQQLLAAKRAENPEFLKGVNPSTGGGGGQDK
jgi:hypothetical protein